MPAFFAEKTLFLACMPITDYFAAATIWTGRLYSRFFRFQHKGGSLQQRRYFIFCKFIDVINEHFLIGHGIILLNMRELYHFRRPIKRTQTDYQHIYGLTPLEKLTCKAPPGRERLSRSLFREGDAHAVILSNAAAIITPLNAAL